MIIFVMLTPDEITILWKFYQCCLWSRSGGIVNSITVQE